MEQDGFVLENAVKNYIARGMFKMVMAPREMDLHGGTDFVLNMEGFRVSIGLTLRDDVCKFSSDAEKFKCWAQRYKLASTYAPFQIEIVVKESDPIDWDAALLRGLVGAEAIATRYKHIESLMDWASWSEKYFQVVVYAKRDGFKVVTRKCTL